MRRRKRALLVIAALPAGLLVLFFATAHYGAYCGGHYISRPPVATISWGPAQRYIVQQGINAVGDSGMGMPGNFLEFPISGGTRISIRFFSLRWSREEFTGWASSHRRLARWLGWDSSSPQCPRPPASPSSTS